MNFKLKLALVATAASLLAAPAFAADGFDTTTALTADAVFELAVTELSAVPVLSGDGNVALIAQEGTGHIAYIDQSGTDGLNFAAIAQAATLTTDIASITQAGTLNRASVFQR